MKLTNSKDGVRRATIRIEYRLTEEELVTALAIEAETFHMVEDLPELGRNKALEMIRNSLRAYGEDVLWGKEVGDEYREWAERQIEGILK